MPGMENEGIEKEYFKSQVASIPNSKCTKTLHKNRLISPKMKILGKKLQKPQISY